MWKNYSVVGRVLPWYGHLLDWLPYSIMDSEVLKNVIQIVISLKMEIMVVVKLVLKQEGHNDK